MNGFYVYNQDEINRFSNYLLQKRRDLLPLIAAENWKEVFNALYPLDKTLDPYFSLGFLYQYFKDLDNINILTYLQTIPYSSFDSSDIPEIDIPDNITRIGSYAFCNSNLIGVNIGKGVTHIEEDAFFNCKNLKNIHFKYPSNLTDIESAAFAYLPVLESLELPEGLQKIDAEVFIGCDNLKELVLPSSLKFIGGGAFEYCDLLSEIAYNGTKAMFVAINKDKGWNEQHMGKSIARIKCSDGLYSPYLTDDEMEELEKSLNKSDN